MTSHAAQGQTFSEGVIVDLCIGNGSNPLGSYAALTWVTSKRFMGISLFFLRALFTRGKRDGPQLLLSQLRGELDAAEWKAVGKKYMLKER